MRRLLLQMILSALLLALLLAASACTLGTAQDAREDSLNATQTALPLVAATTAATNAVALTPLVTSQSQATPALQSNEPTGCEGRLRVDVGTDPGNTLRLREQPNNSSTIILLIPNNTTVNRVAGSQDVNAGGYNWVNIQYTDPNGVQAVGWAARDAIRDRTTLREEGC